MTQATVQSITNTYQQQIKLHDQAIHMTLSTAHEQAVRQIQPHLDHLYHEVERKQQAGEAITIAWLYRDKRMQTIKQVVTQHIDGFANFAHMMSTTAQQQGVALGSHSGHAQVRGVAQHGQLIHTLSQQAVNALSEHQDNARARLFAGYGAEAAKGVTQSILAGASLKQSVKQLASGVLGKLKTSPTALLSRLAKRSWMPIVMWCHSSIGPIVTSFSNGTGTLKAAHVLFVLN